MIKTIRITGIGGQGAIKSGIILAKSIFELGLNVVQTQTYGAEVRKGIVSADIIFSENKNEQIYELNINKFDYYIIMARDALNKYKNQINEKCTIIMGESFFDEKLMQQFNENKIYLIPEKKILKSIKYPTSLNMSYLGALSRIVNSINEDAIIKIIKSESKSKYLEDNLLAFKLGIREVFKI